MIVGRLVNASSKLALSKTNKDSALWELCGVTDDKVDVDEHCYEAMDKLYKSQDRIQKTLAEKHLHNGSLVLYDITSSYLEGEYSESELVKYGYNRDKKRGHEQIVISLLCNSEGCPVAVDVFAGNTKDESTVSSKIDEMKGKYNIENVIFVGDRGMITKAQYDKIDHQTVKTISALTHNNIKALCKKEVIQLSFFDEKNIVEVADPDNEGIRYCLCKNPMMTEKEGKTRQALLNKTAEELNKIASSERKCKDSKAVRLGKVISKYNMAKFVIYSLEDDVLTWSFDDEKIASEAILDGCYIIYTDVPANEMNAAEVVGLYKSLIKVEQAFRSLKTTKLEIRPIYHKTDDRIRCHVFICMLSYYLMWNMKQRLQPLFEADGDGENRVYSFDYIIERLKSIRSETYDFNGIFGKIITTCDDEQQRILELLKTKM
jgi:transposase